MGLMVLVSSSTELVSRKSLVVTMYHGEYLLASQLRIPFYGMLIDTWVGLMYLEILDLLLLLFSWVVCDLLVVIMNSS